MDSREPGDVIQWWMRREKKGAEGGGGGGGGRGGRGGGGARRLQPPMGRVCTVIIVGRAAPPIRCARVVLAEAASKLRGLFGSVDGQAGALWGKGYPTNANNNILIMIQMRAGGWDR